MRYSTARSGLLKAARIARSTSALGKPMFSRLAIASLRCGPMVRTDGSLKLAPSADAAAAGAGDGVDGAFDVVFDVAGTGASGAFTVCVIAGAGVEGAFEADEEVAGAAFGWESIRLWFTCSDGVACPTFDIMQTMKPFSSILYDSTVFASCKILPVRGARNQHHHTWTVSFDFNAYPNR